MTVMEYRRGMHYLTSSYSVASGAIDTPRLRGALNHLWLASDAASYITGTTIHANAGYSSR
ncbi:hypothetical protein QP794_12300 [Paenibacillus sp. UMB7766-LJ446]|nr:hypothetical protein [Paenibacillus sp. UMB7766-LJ446]